MTRVGRKNYIIIGFSGIILATVGFGTLSDLTNQ